MRTPSNLASHLAVPAYADSLANLRKIMPGVSKVDALKNRDAALSAAKTCRTEATINRILARRQHGDNGGMNPCPVSGGICAHWPEQAKDDVAGYEQLASKWHDIALAWHRYAGKRAHTLPRLA